MAAFFVKKFLDFVKLAFFLFAVFVLACTNNDDQDAKSSALSSQSSSITILKSGSLVQIGSQIWLAENSKAKPRKGNMWCYGDLEQNCEIYGGLYDWEAANNVCPNGYRLPSKEDFDILFDLARERTRELINSSSTFNAILGGEKILDGFGQDLFILIDKSAFWWTSSDGGVKDHAHCYEFNGYKLFSCTYKKTGAFSVRCLLNGDTMPSSSSSIVPRSSSSAVPNSSSSVVPSSSSSASNSISKCGEVPSGATYNPSTEACCGKNKFTLETHFCFGEKITRKCGDKEYDSTKEFCLEGSVVKLCGNSTYTSSKFCFDEPNGPILDKCGKIPTGATYNPNTEACCGTSKYDATGTSTQFCYNNEIYDKCGDLTYDPSTYFCLDEEVTRKCAGKVFVSSQFCSINNNVENKCGEIPSGATYNPNTEACCYTNKFTTATHFCLNDVVTRKCNGEVYSSSQFCFNEPSGPIRNRCGNTPAGITYNPNTEACCGNEKYNRSINFCYSNNGVDEIRPLCGGYSTYIENQFCFEGSVVNRCGGTFLGDTYNLHTEKCCGQRKFTEATDFCYSGYNIRPLCGGLFSYQTYQFCNIYNEVDYRCEHTSQGDTLNRVTDDCCGLRRFTMATEGCCGGQKYTLSTQSCCGTTIYNKSTEACCGTSKYNTTSTSTQFCYNNGLYNKCGGLQYNPSTEFCYWGDNKIYDLCNTQWYNPNTEFCYDNMIYSLCGGLQYDPSIQGCCSGTICM